jgi:hypothetical protein
MKPAYVQSTLLCLPLLLYALGTSAISGRSTGSAESALDRYGVEYVGLVADLGVLNPESVDFQLADPHARARIQARSLRALRDRSSALADHIRSTEGRSPKTGKRARRLAAQLSAITWRSAQLSGEPLAFDDELSGLFGLDKHPIDRPHDDESTQALAQLEHHLPGDGSLSQRLAAYQHRFVIPRGRLDAVMTSALEACRNQTRRLLVLPEGEHLTIEYVGERPWAGYSVYRGGYYSLMQVNRTLPLTVGQALNLACHEGYPGHHVYNSLRERHFMRELGWAEAGALPLFSPEGFRAEAAASAAAAIVFESDERLKVFQQVLFPLVGLDPREAERYAQVCELVESLTGNTTAVVMQYLAGALTGSDAVRALKQHALMEQPQALLAYLDRYRAYALAYTWGRDRLLAGLGDRRGLEERSKYLNRLMTTSEWDFGRQE